MKIGFYAAKGGQGTTTTAAMFAAWAAHQGKQVLFETSLDGFATIGMASPDDHGCRQDGNLTVCLPNCDIDRDFDLYVTDVYGSVVNCDMAIEVIRLDYMSAWCSVTYKDRHPNNVRGFIVVKEDGRALTTADVERAVGRQHIGTINYTTIIARAIDAGLILHRADSSDHPVDTWNKLIDMAKERTHA